MRTDFGDVQRIVMRGGPHGSEDPADGTAWNHAHHLVLCFGRDRGPLQFLLRLGQAGVAPTPADQASVGRQVSLGFSRRGLEKAGVPEHILSRFVSKAPAFYAGAAMRAALHGASIGSNGPGVWSEEFRFTTLDAVLTVHATEEAALIEAVGQVGDCARGSGVEVRNGLPRAKNLAGPEGSKPGEMWVHFGYRDGLSRIGIEGWSSPETLEQLLASTHRAGEFLLGHPQDSGENPWIFGPGSRVWPAEVRAFFRNGSFGVLQQIVQHVGEFERFIEKAATDTGLSKDMVKAKLCGRWPDGRLLLGNGLGVHDDFDYKDDPNGYRCPFGSHIRRMNPRSHTIVHGERARPLLRRGLAYGPAWNEGLDDDKDEKRGLFGHFFCASIEDQFEHLVTMWGDRVPLGSEDRGGARDPLIGAHEKNDGPFHVPVGKDMDLMLNGLSPFTRNSGTAYLFYPSVATFSRMARDVPWRDLDEEGF